MNFKQNWKIILLITGTLILGLVAIFITVNLYKEKNNPKSTTTNIVKKATPTPKPPEIFEQAVPTSTPTAAICEIAFSTVSTPTPSPTPTATGTPSPTPTATATPTGTPSPTTTPTGTPTPTNTPSPQGCFYQCSENSDCSGNMSCLDYQGTFRCLNASCPEQSSCSCTTPTPTTTTKAASTATPTPEVTLAKSGFSLPTFGAIGGGVVFILASILLVL